MRFRIVPLTDRNAAQLVCELKSYRLLQDYCGHPPADVEAIEDVRLRLFRLVEEIHEISELDLNPIFTLPPGQGCKIVDLGLGLARTLDLGSHLRLQGSIEFRCAHVGKMGTTLTL